MALNLPAMGGGGGGDEGGFMKQLAFMAIPTAIAAIVGTMISTPAGGAAAAGAVAKGTAGAAGAAGAAGTSAALTKGLSAGAASGAGTITQSLMRGFMGQGGGQSRQPQQAIPTGQAEAARSRLASPTFQGTSQRYQQPVDVTSNIQALID